MKTILLPTIAVLLLTSCDRLKPREFVPAVSDSKSDNPTIMVELVLTHNGITVYRFWDGWKYVYYTDARGATQWSETVPAGKGTRQEDHSVQTVK